MKTHTKNGLGELNMRDAVHAALEYIIHSSVEELSMMLHNASKETKNK